MTQLLFCTTNSQKFGKGYEVCLKYGIKLIQKADLDIDEVQSEDTNYVARLKAQHTYEKLGTPMVISDDAWHIVGLNGFPGTYAKSVNTWFSADDYLRLTRDLTDRTIWLEQTLVYQDAKQQKTFTNRTRGILLKQQRGSAGICLQKVVSLEPDGKKSISEMIGKGTHYQGPTTQKVWHDFASWYAKIPTP